MSKPKGFTLVELLVVIVVISLLAGLVIPAAIRALCLGKQGTMTALVSQLEGACKNYEIDNAVYPPGDGTGSDMLVAALTQPGPKGIPYVNLKRDQLNEHGHIVNIIYGSPEVVYYRRNRPNPPAHAWNPHSFDIWAKDCNGDPEGISNR